MAYSTGSFGQRDTNDTSKGYGMTAADNSYKYYNNITWNMWVCLTPSTNKNLWGMWEEATNNRCWLFSTQTNGTFRVIYSWDGTNFSLHTTSGVPFNGSWVMITNTFASGTFNTYFNAGAAQTLNQVIAWGGGAVALHSAGQRLLVGSQNPASPVADKSVGGFLSNYSMWNKVLSAAERTELYNNGVPTNLLNHSAAANLTNWWPMDQADTAPTLRDAKNGSGSAMTITTSGTSGYFAASGLYPTRSTDPGVANVRFGTTYVLDGENKTGTMIASGGSHLGPRQGVGA